MQPGAGSGEIVAQRPGEDLVFVLEGTLEFVVDGHDYRLEQGDVLHLRTDRPHHWHNPGNHPAQAVWVSLRPL